MQYIGAFIRQLPSGGFKAYFWGQPDMHIMDWNGANYRYKVVPAAAGDNKEQPFFGYKTKEEALQFLIDNYPDERDLGKVAEKEGDGSFLPDEMCANWIDVNFKPQKKWAIHEKNIDEKWFWSCLWDDGVGKDRDFCRAHSSTGFETKEEAEAAGNRHLKKAKHKSCYPERASKKAKLNIYKKRV